MPLVDGSLVLIAQELKFRCHSHPRRANVGFLAFLTRKWIDSKPPNPAIDMVGPPPLSGQVVGRHSRRTARIEGDIQRAVDHIGMRYDVIQRRLEQPNLLRTPDRR